MGQMRFILKKPQAVCYDKSTRYPFGHEVNALASHHSGLSFIPRVGF